MGTWKYTKEGTIILTKGTTTVLLQNESDIETFLDYMGEKIEDVSVGDGWEFDDSHYGYFE